MLWEDYFFNILDVVASRSNDPRTKVGAVITDKNNRIVSTGYNDLPKGVVHIKERYLPPSKYNFISHGEENAILFAKRDLSDCILYLPFMSCSRCARMVIQSGIRKVIIDKKNMEKYLSTSESKTKDEFSISQQMFDEAGVEVTYWERNVWER
jgi:dCMP deaminase